MGNLRGVAVAMVALAAGCSRVPSKPASVPAGAEWATESRKGMFVQITHVSGTLWQVGLWDRKGTPLASGAYRLRGFARARIYADEVLDVQNGAVQLKDGTWLVPEPAAAKP